MKTIHSLAAVGSLCLSLVLSGAESSPKIGGGSVVGQVVGSSSGGPLGGAHLTLISAQIDASGASSTIVSTYSDKTGGFSFTEVPPGTYRLVGAHLRAITTDALGTMRGQPVPMIRITEGERVEAKLVLQEKLWIEGQVTLENGEPAAGAKVEAILLNRFNGLLMPTVMKETTADRRGHYDLDDLRPGQYVVSAVLRMPSVTSVAGNDPRPTAKGLSNGSRSLLEANPITLSTAPHGADIRLTASESLSIRGSITTATGVPALAHLIPADSTLRGLDAFLSSAADEQGMFAFENVEPGHYYLVGSVRTPDGSVKDFTLEELILNGRSISDRKIRPAATATVSVQLQKGANGLPPLRMHLTPTQQELLALDAIYQGVTNQDGKLLLPNVLPGKYRVTFEGQGAVAENVEVDGVSLKPGDTLRISAGQTLSIRARTATANSNVRGSVARPENSPIGGVVVLIPTEAERRSDGANFYTAEIDQKGAWEVTGVQPGKYTVVATTALAGQEYMDSQLIASLLPQGKEIDVEERTPGPVNVEGLSLRPR